MLKVLITLSLLLFTTSAFSDDMSQPSHNHSLYDQDCCQLSECRPIACNELRPQADGTIVWQGNGIRAQKIRPSKDKDCHVCATITATYCAYIGAPQG
jgi:hypothetical protein